MVCLFVSFEFAFRGVNPADFNQMSLCIQLWDVNFVDFNLPLVVKSLLQFHFFAGKTPFIAAKQPSPAKRVRTIERKIAMLENARLVMRSKAFRLGKSSTLPLIITVRLSNWNCALTCCKNAVLCTGSIRVKNQSGA